MKNNYYLVCMNKDTKEITLLKKSSLEEIDLYTINKSEKDLLIKLLDDGKINSLNQDIFIIKKSGKTINYLECIYNDTYYKSSLEGAIKKDNKSINNILNEFIKTIKNNRNYYNYVNLGLSNIYKKFYDYFRHIELDINLLYKQKYKDGKWAMNSYTLIRSIIESFNIFFNNPTNEIINIKKNKYEERNKAIDEIHIITSENYIPGQINMFQKIKK